MVALIFLSITLSIRLLRLPSLELLEYRVAALEATAGMGCYRRPEGDCRLINLKFIGGGLTQPTEVEIKCQGETSTHLIDPGNDPLYSAEVYLPWVSSDKPVTAKITLKSGSQGITTTTQIDPVRKWEINLIHQI